MTYRLVAFVITILLCTLGFVINALYQTKSVSETRQRSKLVRTIFHPTESVYIAAYARGGSTFLGDIFNKNNDVFYWFEPLAGVFEAAAHSYVHVHRNGTFRPFNSSLVNRMTGTIEDIFTCDLYNLSKSVMNHRFVTSLNWDMSVGLHQYKLCMRTKRGASCLRDLQRICHKSKYKVIKDIRLPLSDVETLIKKHDSMKVIYQTRDPRGVLHSRWSASKKTPKFPQDPRYLCEQMREDWKSLKRLNQTYPGVLLWNRYEDMATKPLTVLREIYGLLGMSVSENLLKWMNSTTHSHSDGNVMSTRRRNSTATAYRWRNELTSLEIRQINNECSDVIKSFGLEL